ncbi:exported hypothetical protein [Xenorhabdus bovienii str. kraussei Quebec]|uniref:Uncharacterized protein n=1 Tax=Xenorhabdus bovienii str. kraussei Quebec TaxID=1398203 RepID=A0A077PLT4_XENBV|nr:exported hypothetical protein [Xenorhabdus bovienii str. kraussei Quebec]
MNIFHNLCLLYFKLGLLFVLFILVELADELEQWDLQRYCQILNV